MQSGGAGSDEIGEAATVDGKRSSTGTVAGAASLMHVSAAARVEDVAIKI